MLQVEIQRSKEQGLYVHRSGETNTYDQGEVRRHSAQPIDQPLVEGPDTGMWGQDTFAVLGFDGGPTGYRSVRGGQ